MCACKNLDAKPGYDCFSSCGDQSWIFKQSCGIPNKCSRSSLYLQSYGQRDVEERWERLEPEIVIQNVCSGLVGKGGISMTSTVNVIKHLPNISFFGLTKHELLVHETRHGLSAKVPLAIAFVHKINAALKQIFVYNGNNLIALLKYSNRETSIVFVDSALICNLKGSYFSLPFSAKFSIKSDNDQYFAS